MGKFIACMALSMPVYLLMFKGLEAKGIPEWYFQVPICIVATLLYDAAETLRKRS